MNTQVLSHNRHVPFPAENSTERGWFRDIPTHIPTLRGDQPDFGIFPKFPQSK